MSTRSGNVDFAKFIASMLIVAHHIYHLGISGYPFHEAWVYVEFFLLITGFYTAKHFSVVPAENKPKEAFQYTLKKFLPIFPYAFIISFAGWVTNGIIDWLQNPEYIWKNFVINFMGRFPFDLLLLTESFGYPLITPLWYISAMLIVFPLFCLIVQIKNRYAKLIICFVLPLLYYGWIGVSGNRDFPHDLLRVMAGMMLGLVVYEISQIFASQIALVPKHVLTFIELAAFVYPILCCYNNYAELNYTTTRVYLLCFFVNLLLCLPGFSYTSDIKGKLVSYLGKLSLPIFITHWYVGTIVKLIAERKEWGNGIRIAVYYASSIVFSMLLMVIIDKNKKYNAIVKKEINLID